ncbi:MAG: methyl-accepting chemotaxis protein [Defluviitaleaceae bacterium]|nr:methyl-accepting chemotaxis protein [Defluviitaleaceae bacterium]
MSLKQWVFNVIRDDGHVSPLNKIFSHSITALIFLNIGMVMFDLIDIVPYGWQPVFDYVELVAVIVFMAEYILRLWTANYLFPRKSAAGARLKFAVSPMALVDLLAIAPFYLPFALPVNTTILRLLRLLRLMRIMKLSRYSDTKTAEVVLATIHEAVVLIDRDNNFLDANEAAFELFPLLRYVKKQTPVAEINDWPDSLKNLDDENDFRRFSVADKHFSTKINHITDGQMILRYVVIIHEVTELVLREQAEIERGRAVAELVSVMKNFGEGNFNCEIGEYTGDWAWANDAINTLHKNFTDAIADIGFLAKAATEGNFSFLVDESKYKGNWAELVHTLNNLVVAVETPLSQIEYNVMRMSQGDFSPIPNEYKGRFETVIAACNRTNEITLSYVNEIAQVLESVAHGDLTVAVKKDFIGSYAPIKTALDTILDSLNATMADIAAATGQVATGAAQISQSTARLAQGASSQSGAVHTLTGAMDNINQGAKKSAENAAALNERAQSSTAHAKQGEEVIRSMNISMEKVKKSSSDISQINKVISDIAFQTNLLALNASVEAARAGAHGRSFSVVADEVRSLAGRSSASTSETDEIIKTNSQSASDVELSARDVEEAFATVSANIAEMSGLIGAIVQQFSRQAESISEANADIDEISKAVLNNSAATQESAAASQQLNAQAEILKQLVSFFKLK